MRVAELEKSAFAQAKHLKNANHPETLLVKYAAMACANNVVFLSHFTLLQCYDRFLIPSSEGNSRHNHYQDNYPKPKNQR